MRLSSLFLFYSLFHTIYGFVPHLVILGKDNLYYANYYATFFHIPLIQPQIFVAPRNYVMVVEDVQDLGYFLDEPITIVDMKKFHTGKKKSGNHFISWVLQTYT